MTTQTSQISMTAALIANCVVSCSSIVWRRGLTIKWAIQFRLVMRNRFRLFLPPSQIACARYLRFRPFLPSPNNSTASGMERSTVISLMRSLGRQRNGKRMSFSVSRHTNSVAPSCNGPVPHIGVYRQSWGFKMSRLPDFSFDHTVSMRAAKHDKISLRIKHGLYRGTPETLDAFRRHLGGPSERASVPVRSRYSAIFNAAGLGREIQIRNRGRDRLLSCLSHCLQEAMIYRSPAMRAAW